MPESSTPTPVEPCSSPTLANVGETALGKICQRLLTTMESKEKKKKQTFSDANVKRKGAVAEKDERKKKSKRQEDDENWHWKNVTGGLPRLTSIYDFDEMKRKYKPDRYGKNVIRDNEGMISPEEVEGWDKAYNRLDVKRVRVGKDPKDWPSINLL